MVDFLRACVEARLNLVICGGTGSGKTTFLNMLSSFIPEGERIVTIEDAAELRLNQSHIVRLEGRPPNLQGAGEVRIRELVRNALRMRPDRIIVGECRGAEALDMLQAMNTGHDGSLTTIHANSARDAISRIETMVMMAGFELPISAIRDQIASAIDIIVHISRMRDGSRKVLGISEIAGLEGEVVTMQEIIRYRQRGLDKNNKVVGAFEFTGVQPECLSRFSEFGVSFDIRSFSEMGGAPQRAAAHGERPSVRDHHRRHRRGGDRPRIVLAAHHAPLRPHVEQYRLALEQADVKVRGEEILLAILGTGIAIWVLLLVFLHLSPLYGAAAFPISMTIAACGADQLIAHKRRKRFAKFADQLELVLRLMASGLRPASVSGSRWSW